MLLLTEHTYIVNEHVGTSPRQESHHDVAVSGAGGRPNVRVRIRSRPRDGRVPYSTGHTVKIILLYLVLFLVITLMSKIHLRDIVYWSSFSLFLRKAKPTTVILQKEILDKI